MRVAVCDDEGWAVRELCDLLQTNPMVETVQYFSAMEKFWQQLEDGCRPDVVFMDIDWNQTDNGMDFAHQLYSLCPEVQVIFITGYHGQYTESIFLQDCNLCGYLEKPVEPDILCQLLEKAEKNAESGSDPKLLIQQNRTVQAIPLRSILYLESAAHQVRVHTKEEIISYYDRLDHFKDSLPSCFLQCHKSYLVNMNYIRRVDKNEIILQTGESVPISKARYTETRNAYFRYVEAML